MVWLAELPLSATRGEEPATDSRRPQLISGQLDLWGLWALAALSVTCVATAIAFWIYQPRSALWPSAAATVAVVSTMLAFGVQWRRRAWLSFEGDRCRLIDRGGEQEFLATEIGALSVSTKPRHSFGNLVADEHRATFWFTGSGRPPLAIRLRSVVDEPSPLQPLIQRVQSRLVERAESAIQRRQTIAGAGWEWKDDSLKAAGARQPVRVELENISAVDWTTDQLRVWTNADPIPAIALPRGERDVWLLLVLLARRYGRPGEPGVIRGSGLGRVLRESRSRSAAVMSFSLAVFAAIVAGVCFATAIGLRMLPLALVGGGVGLTAMALLSASMRLWRSSFRLLETGVSQSSLGGERYLGFSEIDQFAFDARRQYSKGRYLGTLFTMVFVSESRPRDSIFHTERAPFETEELLQLRERVAEEIASRLARRWTRDRAVPWTRELTLRADGLRYIRRRLFLLVPRAVDLPFSQIRDFDIRGGQFLVWGVDSERPLVSVRTSSPNFYPGLLLFEQILQGPIPA